MILRATIVLLLVLNVGVGAWWLLHDSPLNVLPPSPVTMPQLQLMAEAPAGRITTVPAAPAKPVLAPVRVAAAMPAPPAPPATVVDSNESAQCTGSAADTRGWRVVLPQLPDLAAAEAMAARIAAAGFSDYLVMRDGGDANAIALGSYGTREAAQRRVSALHAAGFPVRCVRIPA